MTTPADRDNGSELPLLRGYPADLLRQVRLLLAEDGVPGYLARRYPERHEIRSDKALYAHVDRWRQSHLRHAPRIDRVRYDNTLDVIEQALGQHVRRTRVQGGRLQVHREIRIASLFKEAASGFLDMIVVHELAHLKVMDHDRSFYQLCEHMLPSYAQREFDFRLQLTWERWQKRQNATVA